MPDKHRIPRPPDSAQRSPPTIDDGDLRLFEMGAHERLWEMLGAHPRTIDGADGVAFAVWAPNARAVRLVGDASGSEGETVPMRALGSSGVWELFVSGLGSGALYRYEVVGADGVVRLKIDPMALSQQLQPEPASRVWKLDPARWTDAAWMAGRATRDLYRSPMAACEVHLGSWMRNPDGSWLGYRSSAEKLVAYCRRFGFTHVELLPVAEHPFTGSWGYQVTGFYAPTARFGSPDDFQALVDILHGAGIGVILDWVPGHFPADDFGLARFDGTALYEHRDPARGEHPDWGTLIFDYGRPQVRNFLVANARFWFDQFHVDGLRVDAVASMLYLDYSRAKGTWKPNRLGGNQNLEAIEFLREMNERVYARHPGIFTVAEESTAFPGVTLSTDLGGLGFGFKWDMGWMHDTLAYFRRTPKERALHPEMLTFRSMYLHTEHFVLPLSHDEVVHEKRSLLGKMPGHARQRFANLRSLIANQYLQPGTKLLFMGTELAPMAEWDHDRSLPWETAEEPMRAAFAHYLEDLGRLYLATPALFGDGFAWIVTGSNRSGVFAWMRGDESRVVVIQNLAPLARHDYRVGLPAAGAWEEIFNSERAQYGGSGLGNPTGIQADGAPSHGQPVSAALTLPALGTLVLRPAPR